MNLGSVGFRPLTEWTRRGPMNERRPITTVVTSEYRSVHIFWKNSSGSSGFPEGRSEPGYLANSPRPSSVMYRFAVIFRVISVLPRVENSRANPQHRYSEQFDGLLDRRERSWR